MPARLSTGPYAGHRALPGVPSRKARWVFLAGPVANLAAAVFAYALYLAQPMPFFRLLAVVQLAAAGFSLLPFEPLDGAALGRERKERSTAFLLIPMGLALAGGVFGAALTFGLLGPPDRPAGVGSVDA